MDLDRLERIMYLLSAFFFAVMVVGIIGELRGWWHELGESVISLGGIASVATAVIGFLIGATKRQVKGVTRAVLAGNSRLDRIDGKLDALDKLDQIDVKLEALDKLDHIDGKLDKLDRIDVKLERLDGLDRIQAELDRQTGVMDRQVALLTQIRDGLAG